MPARRPAVTISNSAADRAGRLLRIWWEGDDETHPVTTEIGDAWDVMNAYRAMHEEAIALRERFDTLVPLIGVYFPAEPE